MKLNDEHVDEIMQEAAQPGKHYYYDFLKARKIDLEAEKLLIPVNSFLNLYQRLTGRSIGTLERLQELLAQGTDLYNEQSWSETVVLVKEKKKAEERGYDTDKVLPFFGVDLTHHETAEHFLTALRPLYIQLGAARLVSSELGYTKKVYNLRPLYFGDKFEIKGNELVTTRTHAEERDNACKRFATTPEQIQRVKSALDFIKPFKEMEKHISNQEVISKKSYVQELGLPFPVCIVVVNAERKELLPNPEYVEGIQLYPKAKPQATGNKMTSYLKFTQP